MHIKKHIPNAITCGNLFCGCLAIVAAFNGNLIWSAYLVGIAAVLDFFDGFAARLLKTSGELGKQLDSLADMVTFGAVPGVVMYKLLSFSLTGLKPSSLFTNNAAALFDFLPLAAFSITIFSALRLAKFNIDTRQTTSFIGLPTPANAILICSIPLILRQIASLLSNDPSAVYAVNPALLIIITMVMSFLLVAELPLFALKFKNFSWTDNKIRYAFLIISLILLILFQFIAIPFIIFLYISISFIDNIRNKKTVNNKS